MRFGLGNWKFIFGHTYPILYSATIVHDTKMQFKLQFHEKNCLKMSRPNFEFSKSHMTFGPKVAIFYQFMHYKCHICVEFFWNVDFRRHEKLLLTTIFQIRKSWFSVKTRILPVFLHHNIIFKYTKIKNNILHNFCCIWYHFQY